MRHNVAISTLFACLIGLATADGTDNLGQENSSSNASLVFNPLTTYPVFQLTPNAATTFTFENHTVLNVNTVKLKRYDPKGAENGQNDEIVTEYSGAATGAPATTIGEEKPSLNLSDHTVLIQWTQDVSDYYNKLFYVECEWTNSVGAGNSTSEIFAPYQETNTIAKTLYLDQKDKARDFHSQEAIAARGELFTATPSPPSPTKTPETTSSTPTASRPASTIGISNPTKAGLSQGATIGIAVGVSVAGLIIAGVLGWFFCFRRRRNQKTSKTHHMMQSYSSDVGGQAMIADKEMPVVLEATAPQYADSSRPSGDVYAPYSDRSAVSPVLQPVPLSEQHQHQHHRTTSSNVTSSAAAAVPVSPAGASEPDLSWGRGAPTPTSLIASRYAHLVEEGMTEDEIRRLEEEERQLDAAIENAGRRGHNHNPSS
ncbi:hypothetical protein F5Y08DRAFT_97010 [Xylaria arbuscula]|nr:hypothetical protein F5Y08DRAFT_97010 [Xylaria arbuscula]